MIREICQFVETLEEQAPELFEEGAKLKEGIYIALDIGLEDGEYVLKNVDENGNILKEDIIHHFNGDELTPRILEIKKILKFTARVSVNKSFNSSDGLFIATCNPFTIGFSKKNFQNKIDKDPTFDNINIALKAYFKAAKVFVSPNDIEHFQGFKKIIENKLFDFVNQFNWKKLRNNQEVIFFYKNLPLQCFEYSYSLYQKERVFNKNEYNIHFDNSTYGIPDDLSTFTDSKLFLRHQTASFKMNFRVDIKNVLQISNFYKLIKNNLLPNPLPIFVNTDEANTTNGDIFKLFNNEGVTTYSDIIKQISQKREHVNLQNFYLLLFKVEKNKRRVIDIDFVPLFRYQIDCKIRNLLSIPEMRDKMLNNVFELEKELNKVFTKNHRETGKGYGFLKENYFTNKVESQKPFTQYHVQREILAAFYKYRFSIYEYVYKSKLGAITSLMFDDMMLLSIKADINCDEFKDNYHSKDYAIKEKLNIWFSLYNFFELSQNLKRIDMGQNLKQHREMMQKLIADNYDLSNDEEFAFASGQIIYYIFSKSVSADKSYSKLEPFIQKTDCSSYKQSIVRIFDMYKHENFTTKFSRCMAQVMDFDTDRNLKELTPFILAGFFSENLLFSDNNQQ